MAGLTNWSGHNKPARPTRPCVVLCLRHWPTTPDLCTFEITYPHQMLKEPPLIDKQNASVVWENFSFIIYSRTVPPFFIKLTRIPLVVEPQLVRQETVGQNAGPQGLISRASHLSDRH